MRIIRTGSFVLGSCLMAVTAACGGTNEVATAEGVEELLAGRTIQVIVNHSAGGGSDILARFVVDRLGEELPGQPRVQITNQEGLGGLANVYDASADDLVIGVTSRSSNIYTTLLEPDVTIDPEKVQLVGGLGDSPRGLIVFGDHAAAHPTLADSLGSDSSLRFAATVGGPADITSSSMLLSWLCANVDLTCEMIPIAEDGSADLDLMVERGEINVDDTNMTTVVRNHTERILDGDAAVYFQYGESDFFVVEPPEGVDAPAADEVLSGELQEDFERLLPLITGGGVGFTFFVGPEMPADVLQALREAYISVTTEGAEDLGELLAGTGDEGSVTLTPMAGAEAQDAYESATSTFVDSMSYYEELQNDYWEQFWQ